jgi:hypothetical protein
VTNAPEMIFQGLRRRAGWVAGLEGSDGCGASVEGSTTGSGAVSVRMAEDGIDGVIHNAKTVTLFRRTRRKVANVCDNAGVPDRVDELRGRLRELGYLSHGIERWFALDPWSSRTFWIELTLVAAKAGLLLCGFAAAPMVAVMWIRNAPLGPADLLLLFGLYGGGWFVASFLLTVALALVLKVKPALPLDRPRFLLGVSIAATALVVLAIAAWWFRFDRPPSLLETAIGIALIVLFFALGTIGVSAALLSFSIYELQRAPAFHQRSRTVPIAAGAAGILAVLFVPAWAAQREEPLREPLQVVTTPSRHRIALVAVDGVTFDMLNASTARSELRASAAAAAPPGGSAAERWASVGTGTPARLHHVRAIAALQVAGSDSLLQSISRGDFLLGSVAPLLGAGRLRALPPAVRRRDYVWEIFAARGIPSAAVDWWASEQRSTAALQIVGQEAIFHAATSPPAGSLAMAAVRIDEAAAARLLRIADPRGPQFVTVYLPAVDIILNRVELDAGARVSLSLRALEGLRRLIHELQQRGYDCVVVGLPGDRQAGRAVIASTLPLESGRGLSAFDVAPTLCALLGFPASNEMPGHSLLPDQQPARIATYGERRIAPRVAAPADQEYFDNLRSLGYVR